MTRFWPLHFAVFAALIAAPVSLVRATGAVGTSSAKADPAPKSAAKAKPAADKAGSGESPGADAGAGAAKTELKSRQSELRGLEDKLGQSAKKRRKIKADIEGLRNDRARLNAALIATTQNVRAAETAIAAAEKKLASLSAKEQAARRSLLKRKATIEEVLVALQRMGRSLPPAVLVDPEDMLRAVRSSILLGAVLPQMRAKTKALAADLAKLVRLHNKILRERRAHREELAELQSERQRLNSLIDARQASLGTAQTALAAQQKAAEKIAARAANLKDLITQMQSQIAAAAKAAAAARKAERKLAEAKAGKSGPNGKNSSLKNMARLAPAIAFADAKGRLSLPVVGTIVKNYGAPDGFGGTEKGLFIETRPGAVVSLPSDGWIAFCGPYRSYGQLLIVNVGQGYYIVLAGMKRINVEVGQFVLAGEPVATMGDGSAKTAAAIAIGAAKPTLYVEFRKDGAAINPSPWWAKADVQKVRG